MCDQCGSAEALVTVSKGRCRLEFCGHHYSSNELALAIRDWHVIEDSRATLWPELAKLKT